MHDESATVHLRFLCRVGDAALKRAADEPRFARIDNHPAA